MLCLFEWQLSVTQIIHCSALVMENVEIRDKHINNAQNLPSPELRQMRETDRESLEKKKSRYSPSFGARVQQGKLPGDAVR